MGILDRMTRLIRANLNDIIDRSENPQKMLDQIIREMNEQIHMARGQVATMIAQEKELQADYNEVTKNAQQWERKAELAVQQGKDDLAREALRRKRDNEESVHVYSTQLGSQQEMVAKLKTQLQQLEAKYEQARSSRDVLIARQKRAEAVQRISSTMSGVKALEPSEELERMERRIRSNESRALAEQELASSTLDVQFKALDSDVEVEDDLMKLKARVQGGGALPSGMAQGALPAGSPVATPMDDDLSAVRERMEDAPRPETTGGTRGTTNTKAQG